MHMHYFDDEEDVMSTALVDDEEEEDEDENGDGDDMDDSDGDEETM